MIIFNKEITEEIDNFIIHCTPPYIDKIERLIFENDTDISHLNSKKNNLLIVLIIFNSGIVINLIAWPCGRINFELGENKFNTSFLWPRVQNLKLTDMLFKRYIEQKELPLKAVKWEA